MEKCNLYGMSVHTIYIPCLCSPCSSVSLRCTLGCEHFSPRVIGVSSRGPRVSALSCRRRWVSQRNGRPPEKLPVPRYSWVLGHPQLEPCRPYLKRVPGLCASLPPERGVQHPMSSHLLCQHHQHLVSTMEFEVETRKVGGNGLEAGFLLSSARDQVEPGLPWQME